MKTKKRIWRYRIFKWERTWYYKAGIVFSRNLSRNLENEINEINLIQYEAALNNFKGYEKVKIYKGVPTRFDFTNQIMSEIGERMIKEKLSNIKYDIYVSEYEEYGMEYGETFENIELDKIIETVYEESVMNCNYTVGCLKVSIKPVGSEEYIEFCDMCDNGEVFLILDRLEDLVQSVEKIMRNKEEMEMEK